ncbi:hypothetical protein Bca4012_064331 [Brassica carinata]
MAQLIITSNQTYGLERDVEASVFVSNEGFIGSHKNSEFVGRIHVLHQTRSRIKAIEETWRATSSLARVCLCHEVTTVVSLNSWIMIWSNSLPYLNREVATNMLMVFKSSCSSWKVEESGLLCICDLVRSRLDSLRKYDSSFGERGDIMTGNGHISSPNFVVSRPFLIIMIRYMLLKDSKSSCSSSRGAHVLSVLNS